MEKACSRCGLHKPATNEFFGSLRKAKDGLHSSCKKCLAEWRKADRALHPARYKAVESARHQRHGDKRREANRRNWSDRNERYRAVLKLRMARNGHLYNANRRQKAAVDPEVRAARSEANRRWRETNADALSERRKAEWRNATPARKLRTYFGAAIAHALKGSGKGGRGWQQIVGYTSADLKAHLERQFAKGMTWDNYGDWHVDHIVPVSSFVFSSPEDADFKACWALTNLRPMWAAENVRKSDKRLHLI